MIGQRVGPYAVLERLGSGGMGEVYLAEDTRLGRRVALKRPSESWLSEPDARERLHREASAAGRLTHPNIAAIYDVLDVDSHPYIVMEYVEGESLALLLRRGALPIEKAVDIAGQIADALGAAHAKGVVHRDLKPANISLTPDGHAKVLDFGLAKGPQSQFPSTGALTTITLPGQVMGTPGYSSPEQMVGAAADPRDDIYSLGVVLFELLTGQRPFHGDDALALAVAAMTKNAPAAHDVNPQVPRELSAVVARAMARDRDDRFVSADDLRNELRLVSQTLSTQVTGTLSAATLRFGRRAFRRALPIVALMVAGWSIPVGLWWWLGTRAPRGPAVPVLAVLPFTNHSNAADDGPIAAAMRDVLIANLGGQPGLNVLSKTSTGEGSLDRADLKKLSKHLGATFLVDGSLQRSGTDLMVSVSVVRGDSGFVVWSDSFSAPEKDVFSLQERISEGVSRAQPIGTSGSTPPRDLKSGTHDVDALTKYGQGVALLERPDIAGNLQRSAQLFRSAVERDPGFALAWARLGEAYWAIYQETRDPKWAADAANATHEALRLDRDQPGVWLSLALIHHGTGRHEVAIGELNQALALQPNSDDAHRLLGQVLQDLGRAAEAEAEYRRAIELRPSYWRNYNLLGGFYYSAGRAREAIEAFTRVTELQPDNARGFHNLGTVYYTQSDNRNALKYWQQAIAIGPMADTHSNIGNIHYDEGRFEEAVDSFRHAVQLSPNDGLIHGNLGDAHARLNQQEQARRAYLEAVRLDRQVLNVNPNDATTLARLAVRETKLGQRADAERDITRAVFLKPTDAQVLYHGAVVRALHGETEAALALLEQALQKGHSATLAARDRDLASIKDTRRFRDLMAGR